MVRLIASRYQSSSTEMNKDEWTALSSYVHSNHLQLQNWLNTVDVEAHYSDEAIAELIKRTRLAANLAFHAAHTIST